MNDLLHTQTRTSLNSKGITYSIDNITYMNGTTTIRTIRLIRLTHKLRVDKRYNPKYIFGYNITSMFMQGMVLNINTKDTPC